LAAPFVIALPLLLHSPSLRRHCCVPSSSLQVLKWVPSTDRWAGTARQDQKVKLAGLVVCISGT